MQSELYPLPSSSTSKASLGMVEAPASPHRAEQPSGAALSRAFAETPSAGAAGPSIEPRSSVEDAGTERQVPSLPPVDRGRGAWTFLACAFALELLYWGSAFSFGVWLDYYKTHEPYSSASTTSLSLIGTIYLFLGYISGLPLMYFYSKYPRQIKMSIWAGVAIYGLSMLTASFFHHVGALIVLQGVFPGFSSAICVFPIYPLMGEWFVTRRGIAVGVVIAGGGVGGAFMPSLTQLLLDRFGVPWTLRIWSLGTTLLASLATFYLRPRIPVSTSALAPPSRFDWSGIKTIAFAGCFFSTFLQGLGYFNVGLFLPTFTASLGHGGSGAALLCVFNISCVVAQIAWGWAAYRFPSVATISLSSALGGAAALLLWGFSGLGGLPMLVVFVIAFGLVAGGFNSLWAGSAKAIVGDEKDQAAIIFAGYAIARGLGSVVGPAIGSELYHPSNDRLPRAAWGPDGSKRLVLFVGLSLLGSAVVALVFGGADVLLHKQDGHLRRRKEGGEVVELPVLAQSDADL